MKPGDLVRFFNPVDIITWANQCGLVLSVTKSGLVNVYFPKENETYLVYASLLEVVE